MDSQPQPFPIADISAPAWPRRTSKACASCRRDKIRCDGARPCSGCTKKGYAADQCTDGCENCRRARVRCEDGRPCQRCRQLQLECFEELSVPASRQDASSSSNRPVRAAGSERAKLACQNCRRDNKKCDDQRPCSRCIARGEECVHVLRGPKLVKLRCEGCRQDNKRCEDARPCTQCVQLGRECVSVPRKGRGHGTRVKAACMNCRRDKIRCDGDRPCASCSRKGYDCIDRACKACIRLGNEDDCTHRRGQEVSDRSGENLSTNASQFGSIGMSTDDAMQVNAQASTSNVTVEQSQSPQSYPPTQLPSQQLTFYGPLAMQPFYYTAPDSTMGPGQPPSMMSAMYPQDHRTTYIPYTLMDPSIGSHAIVPTPHSQPNTHCPGESST